MEFTLYVAILKILMASIKISYCSNNYKKNGSDCQYETSRPHLSCRGPLLAGLVITGLDGFIF